MRILLTPLVLLLLESLTHAEVPPDAKLCLLCHTTRQVTADHARVPGNPDACLACHAPHSLTGLPGLVIPSKDRCVVCHFEYDYKTFDKTQKQEGSRLHDPVRDCAACHQPHELGAPASYTGGDKNASCATCHTKTMQQKKSSYQHPPFDGNFCTDCHDPHASKQPRLLRMPLVELCGTCHARTWAQRDLPEQHKPFADGLCTDCHSPHASSFPHNLRVPAEELCVSCHFPEGREGPFQHQPYREGSCTQCHAPHAARAARLIKTESQLALCTTCHVAIKDQFSRASHHPMGGQFACSNCHRPHTADYPGLLQAPGRLLCTTCHPSAGVLYDQIGHSRITASGSQDQGACTTCHQQHGSAEAPLLKGPPVGLCRQCHAPKPEHEHPTGGSTVDPATGKPVTCSSCHDPHGSPHTRSLRYPGDGLCLTCHDL